MASSYPPGAALGAIIRRQRELAALPMRRLAAAVGISNPYLSQIERGLRAPSEAVVNAIADSLQTTVDALYAEAGLVPPSDLEDLEHDGGEPALLQAITEAGELTASQRRTLTEMYQAFVDANAVRRHRARAADGAPPAQASGTGTSSGCS